MAGNPLDEGNHELLVRCLAAWPATGPRRCARSRVCEDLFGASSASSPVRGCATPPRPTSGSPAGAAGGRAAALSQLEAGRAAIMAGAVDAGMQCLRRAVADARAAHGDATATAARWPRSAARWCTPLRGRDEEGAVVLHEAIAVATAPASAGPP